VWISSFWHWKYYLSLYKTSYPYEEVNCTEPFPTVSVPCIIYLWFPIFSNLATVSKIEIKSEKVSVTFEEFSFTLLCHPFKVYKSIRAWVKMNQHHWGQCYTTFLLHKAVFPLAKILGKTASDSDTRQSLLYFALATLGDTTQIEMMLIAKDGRESTTCCDIDNIFTNKLCLCTWALNNKWVR
jgi:hypothetical protein